jgi:hypothetical protein
VSRSTTHCFNTSTVFDGTIKVENKVAKSARFSSSTIRAKLQPASSAALVRLSLSLLEQKPYYPLPERMKRCLP